MKIHGFQLGSLLVTILTGADAVAKTGIIPPKYSSLIMLASGALSAFLPQVVKSSPATGTPTGAPMASGE